MIHVFAKFLLNKIVFCLVFLAIIFSEQEVQGQKNVVLKIKEHLFYSKEVDTKSFWRPKAGYGLSYGFAGVNIEYGWYYFSVHGGMGYAALPYIKGKMGYQYGLRFYHALPDKNIRFRLSLNHGTNQYFYEHFQIRRVVGANVGLGFEHSFTRNGNIIYDMEVNVPIIPTNSIRPDNKELESMFFPSFGIGYKF